MSGRRGVLSPLTTPNLPRRLGSSGFISPSTSHHVGLKSPSVPLLATEHDEAAEKRDRRRSRVLELQRTLESPVSSESSRRKSLPLNGMTASQLADHYANCIKLSAENKINSKNAFGLHLIDFMSEQLKKKELENFQIASTTLDASAKIYAGRVDAIHAETYKVLTGLGRGADKRKQGEDAEEDGEVHEAGDHPEEEKQKKKKKTKKKSYVESNLKNINIKKLDMEVEMDPLFHVMSAAFDEGGCGGLLMNNLQSYDDHQAVALDSQTIVGFVDSKESLSQEQPMDISDIKDLVKGVDMEPLEVCPSFSSFTFTDWDDSLAMEQSSLIPTESKEHEFDVNAEIEPIHDADDPADDLPADVMDFENDDGCLDAGDTDSHVGEEGEISSKGISIGDGKAAQLMERAMQDLTHGTTGTLLQVLASAPSDYSYFNKALLRTWAGPTHWRIGPLSKDSRFKSITEKQQKAKKVLFTLEYGEDVDFSNAFKKSKATTLTKATLTKYSKSRNTLPKDLHYEADKLFRQFVKSKIIIKRQNPTSENIDDGIENYDYENVNDKENFCPKDMDGDDDDDDSHGGDFDFNFTEGSNIEFSQSQESNEFSSPTSSQDLTMLTGDKLVAEPNRVNKIDIAYARTAKKLDVKRLKSTIWNILTTEKEKEKTDEEGGASIETDKNMNAVDPEVLEKLVIPEGLEHEMKSSCTFQELLNTLPQKVSAHTAKDLSVPIAFVCLLHLANEKTLKILDQGDMEDLQILQGI